MLKIPSPITDAKIGKVFHEIDWDFRSDQPAFKTPLVEFLRRIGGRPVESNWGTCQFDVRRLVSWTYPRPLMANQNRERLRARLPD